MPGKRIRRKKGSRVSQRIAELVAQRMRALGGTPNAEEFLASCTSPEDELHGFFPWNDAEAAHKFRLELARRLMNSWEYVDEDAIGRDAVGIPGAISYPESVVLEIDDAPHDKQPELERYVMLEEVTKRPDLIDYYERELRAKLIGIRRQYQRWHNLITEIRPAYKMVFDAIDALEDDEQEDSVPEDDDQDGLPGD